MILTRVALTALVVVAAAVGWSALQSPPATEPLLPAPIDREPGEAEAGFKQWRQRWMDGMLRAAPGVDAKALDAQYRSARMARVQVERAERIAAGAQPADLLRVQTRALAGRWAERGSRNQSGRVTGVERDPTSGELQLLAHGGNFWRGNGSAFRSVNDIATFPGAEHFVRLTGATERWLVASSEINPGLWRTDDQGTSFAPASGLASTNAWYMRALAMRDPGSAEVYLLRVEYDFAQSDWRAKLYASSDRGANFASLGFVGNRNHSTLFSPRYGSSEIYLLTGTQLRRIAPGNHALSAVGTVPMGALGGDDLIALSGGVTAQGQTFLYAARSVAGQTQVYRSVDGGLNWTQRGAAPQTLFFGESLESSPRNPDLLFVGGINLHRSVDGGLSFSTVNDWTEYYANPASKLHADIPDIDIHVDGQGNEVIHISTDGGVYQSTDGGSTVTNLSLSSDLNVSQYYTSYTRRNPPYNLLIGAQDQGYQRAFNPPMTGLLAPEQTISGDYGHLSSSDDGDTVWMVYPTFAMVDTATTTPGQNGLRFWDYAANGLVDADFLAPVMPFPNAPNRALLAGGRISAGSGHRLIELNLIGAGFNFAEGSFEFPSRITAIAFGPTAEQRYVLDDQGRFWRSSDGINYTNPAAGLPGAFYFYGADILVDPANPERIYVAGSGYSNPAVYVSIDGGETFAPMAQGLPQTLIYRLASSADGAQLCAAARTGAFAYDFDQGTWVDIVALGAPNQIYWDVDVVDALGVARFSTYGRGVWDFTPLADLIFASSIE